MLKLSGALLLICCATRALTAGNSQTDQAGRLGLEGRFGLEFEDASSAEAPSGTCEYPGQSVVVVLPDWNHGYNDDISIRAMHRNFGGKRLQRLYSTHYVRQGVYTSGTRPNMILGSMFDSSESCLLLDLRHRVVDGVPSIDQDLGVESTTVNHWWKEVSRSGDGQFKKRDSPSTFALWKALHAPGRASGLEQRVVVALLSRTPKWDTDPAKMIVAGDCSKAQYPGVNAFRQILAYQNAKVIFVRMNGEVEIPETLKSDENCRVLDYDRTVSNIYERFEAIRSAINETLRAEQMRVDVQLVIEATNDKELLYHVLGANWASRTSDFVPGYRWVLSYTVDWIQDVNDLSGLCYQAVGVVGSQVVKDPLRLLEPPDQRGEPAAIEQAVHKTLFEMVAARDRSYEGQSLVIYVVSDVAIRADGGDYVELLDCCKEKYSGWSSMEGMLEQYNVFFVAVSSVNGSRSWKQVLKNSIKINRATVVTTDDFATVVDTAERLMAKTGDITMPYTVGVVVQAGSEFRNFMPAYWEEKPELEVSATFVIVNGFDFFAVDNFAFYGTCFTPGSYRTGMPWYGVKDMTAALAEPVISSDASQNPMTFAILRTAVLDPFPSDTVILVLTDRKPAFNTQSFPRNVTWSGVTCRHKMLPTAQEFRDELEKARATVVIISEYAGVNAEWANYASDRLVIGNAPLSKTYSRAYILVDAGNSTKLSEAMQRPVNLARNHKVIPVGNWHYGKDKEPACLLMYDTMSTGFKTLEFSVDSLIEDKGVSRVRENTEVSYTGSKLGPEYALWRTLNQVQTYEKQRGFHKTKEHTLVFVVERPPEFTVPCQNLTRTNCLTAENVCVEDLQAALLKNRDSPFGRILFVGNKTNAEDWTELFQGNDEVKVATIVVEDGRQLDDLVTDSICGTAGPSKKDFEIGGAVLPNALSASIAFLLCFATWLL